MFRMPSARKRKKNKFERLNLIPVLDAVFIFIFFLISSSTFIQLYEINSDVPIISNKKPKPTKKKPLALTLRVTNDRIVVRTGVPARTIATIGKTGEGSYDFQKLHELAYQLKSQNIEEDSVVLEPLVDLPYEDIIKIIDSVRNIQNTDEFLFKKNEQGEDVQLKNLFKTIIFGNILS